MSTKRDRKPPAAVCIPAEKADGPGSLHALVKDYNQNTLQEYEKELEWYRSLTSDDDRKVAAIWKYGDRCHPHQRRVPGIAKKQAAESLNLSRIKDAKDFEGLVRLVTTMIGSISGIGELAIYDAANRLRMMYGIKGPQKIYLHCGARAGANALQIGRGQPFLERNELPDDIKQAFKSLEPHHIENFLCVYKDRLPYVVRG